MTDRNDDAASGAPLEGLIGEYLDQLTRGQELDPLRILAEHPEHGQEILDALGEFVDLGREPAGDEPLGTLGDYTLRRQIGRGGMGVVYEAWENSMDRRVALKVLPAGIAADERAVARFVREAQLAGRLNHSNVVSVYGMGVKEQTPYYAMEFVEGETLAQMLARIKDAETESVTPFGKKDCGGYFEQLARAFAEVADGLQHAHSKKVIHRDIKPSNLILDIGSDQGGSFQGRLRILDFGLARLEGQEGLTLTGDFLGTPQYMSPEQARRKKIAVDHRTDVYSLGATMYEALVGRPPFLGKDHADTLSQIIERDPAEPRKVNSRVPKELETIVLKCLRKEAGERYGTAEALGQDLRRFVRGDGIEARAEGRRERIKRRMWRSRSRIAIGLLLVAALAGAGWQALLLRQSTLERRTRAYDEKVLSAALHLELASLKQKGEGGEEGFFDPWSGASLQLPAGLDPVELALKDLDEAIRLIPDRPDGAYHRARALLMQQRRDEARDTLAPLIARRPSFVPALTLLAEIQERHGEGDFLKGNLDEAEHAPIATWEKAWIRAWRGWKERTHQEIVAAYSEILDQCEVAREPYVGCAIRMRMARGAASLDAGDYVAALRDFSAARLVAPRAIPPALLEGKVWYLAGRKDYAERIFEETLALSARRDEVALAVELIYAGLHDDEKSNAWIDKISTPSVRETRRCQQLFMTGRIEAAVAAGRKAVAADPKNAGAYDRLGFVLKQMGRLAESQEVLEEGLRASPDSVEINSNLGANCFRRGAYRDAIAFYEKAARLNRTNSRGELYYLAGMYLQVGEREKALATIRKARESTPGDAEGENMFALAFQARGELEEAIATYDRGITSNPSFSYCHINKGLALFALGREEEALACWRSAQTLYPFHVYAFWWPALIFEGHGKIEEAITEILKACERVPDRDEVHAYLAALLRSARGRLADAPAGNVAAALEKALEGAPTSRWCKNSLAEALMLRVPSEPRDLERAASLLLEAFEEQGIPLNERVALSRSLTEVSSTLAMQGSSGEERLAWVKTPPAYAATDAILSAAASAECGTKQLEVLRQVSVDSNGNNRLRYLEARLTERAGDLGSAADGLAEVVGADPASTEPRLQLAEVLRAAGKASEAENALRAGLAASADRRLWDKWLQVCFADLKRSPAEMLAALPEGVPDDLRWLLESLAGSDVLRINCGAEEEYRDKSGRLWGKDRFSLGGWAPWPWSLDIDGTEDNLLYQTERLFPPKEVISSYVLAFPPGRCRVRLHFAEVFVKFPGLRRFDVILQGERVLESFDILREAGFAHPIVKEFDTAVTNSSLEIRFERPPGQFVGEPKISAIEIERLK